jgi:NADP-dependent 3-hydroxy acid dehydrogenase YdfG
MAGLEGKKICLSGNGRGSIGKALHQALATAGGIFIDDGSAPPAVDFAICTVGKMLIRDAGHLDPMEVDALYESNYKIPRLFTERHIQSMKKAGKGGLILHLGSNASRYGNPGAEDYAAFKAALVKYVELRGRQVRDFGIRLSVLNLGAVDSEFWDKVEKTADREMARQIIPDRKKALSVQEAVQVILGLLQMPARVVIKDALVLSVDYQ